MLPVQQLTQTMTMSLQHFLKIQLTTAAAQSKAPADPWKLTGWGSQPHLFHSTQLSTVAN